jgi:hypothetical protein
MDHEPDKLNREWTRRICDKGDAHRSPGGELLWSVMIGPRVFYPAACLAGHDVKRAAPANVSSVSHPHQSSRGIVRTESLCEKVTVGT